MEWQSFIFASPFSSFGHERKLLTLEQFDRTKERLIVGFKVVTILLHWHCATKSCMMSIIRALSSNCTNKVAMKEISYGGRSDWKVDE